MLSMTKGIMSPFFPASQKDVSRLRQSATDAVNDFSTSAMTHANKVGGQLVDLADHLQTEGRTHLHRATGKVANIARGGRELVREHPLACVGVALAIGILVGWSRRRSPSRPNND